MAEGGKAEEKEEEEGEKERRNEPLKETCHMCPQVRHTERAG